MSVIDPSVPAVLATHARCQPDATAFTFVDYEPNPAGVPRTLTWSRIHTHAQVVAAELGSCGSAGDRVAILAPQGLEYIAGFLGAMTAGMVAVPLPVPLAGARDERVAGALKDCAPAAVLTTSAAADNADACVRALLGSSPAVVEIDALDLDTPPTVYSANLPASSDAALLQYTSGSTRAPAGVVVTHQNVLINVGQVFADYFEDTDKAPTPQTTFVSWLPFYHDMGLLVGIFAPVVSGHRSVVTSPMAFLQKPARWVQLLAGNPRPMTAAPNFAYELSARRTTDQDMVGLSMGDVHIMVNGSERVHTSTVRRFHERFAPYGLPPSAMRPSYGLAEATLYALSSDPGSAPTTARFDYEKLAAGYAQRTDGRGSELVGHGRPRACTVRIVDPETRIEKPADQVGEIWIHGGNVADGYWRNPELSRRTFGGDLVNPSPGTPQGPWLRTGDLGVISDDEVFIVGRIKDVLIVDGRNHYPDDIEETIQEITGGRSVAISVPTDSSEQLVTIVELKRRDASDEQWSRMLQTVKRHVTSAISKSHGVRVADLVLVSPGAIPITTSGKVRRSACIERYQANEFSRLEPPR